MRVTKQSHTAAQGFEFNHWKRRELRYIDVPEKRPKTKSKRVGAKLLDSDNSGTYYKLRERSLHTGGFNISGRVSRDETRAQTLLRER